ncbi:MAG: filamentous hemagglutinin [Bradyrhizobium sp.]|nr:filamentous hemagglutinin [Bradyrhizobium sp.]
MIEAGAQLAGGNVLTLASTGDAQVQSGASLSGAHVSALSSSITFVGDGATPPATGMVIDAAILAELASAQSVNLQSYGAIGFNGNVDLRMSGADRQLLTLGGGNLSGDGGQVTITAPTLVLNNTLGAPATASSGVGSLSIDVGQLIFSDGAKALAGFGSVSLIAHQAVIGQGSGSMDFGALPLTLQTPTLIADTSSSQALTTTAALSVVSTGGAVTASGALGGGITLQGGSVTVAVPIQAQAGNITLAASSGDVTITGSGALIAHGVAKLFVDTVQYASGGMIKLAADHGTVGIQAGAVVDFAGAALGGNGGSLTISAGGTVPVQLGGTLVGATVPGFDGSSFNLSSGGALVLDDVAQVLTAAGVSGGIGIHSAQGDLSLNSALTANTIQLVADAGKITINGTITANGGNTLAGKIDLYGTGGVDVEGTLIATGSPTSPKPGGTINIGTTGTGSTSSLNATYGYENVDPSASGSITIGSNALIDAAGGAVNFRAPILDANNAQGMNINVFLPASFNPRKGIFGGSVTLEAYAVWSTADQSTNPGQHFDGIVDPAGWYDSRGNLLSGTFTDAGGNVFATWQGGVLTNNDGTTNNLNYYLTNDYFTPTATNTDPTRAAHETFYGYLNGDDTAAQPGTLMGFVQSLAVSPVTGSGNVANFQVVPGIELDNPVSAGVNNGDIKVLSNWNLGAENSSGAPVFRYTGSNGSLIAPNITFRAAGNIVINASISDGFHETVAFHAPSAPTGTSSNTTVLATYNIVSTNAGFNINNVDTGGLPLDRVGQNAQPPAAYLELGLPSATTANGYYTNYQNYILTWATTFFAVLRPGGFGTGGATQSAAVTAAYDVANAAYSSTDINAYAAYITAYKAYITAFNMWETNLQGALAGTLPVAPLAPPHIAILPSPGVVSNSPNTVATAANLTPIAGMNLASEGSSASYRIVAGADTESADPLAMNIGGVGDVTLDGHTNVSLVQGTTAVIAVPTIVRTGTGSIDVAASGDFQLLDHSRRASFIPPARSPIRQPRTVAASRWEAGR